jgi:ligand-binding sensor protein
MKATIITWHYDYNGGVNNLHVSQVRDEDNNLIKSFSSLKSMEHSRKRATRLKNKLNHATPNTTKEG